MLVEVSIIFTNKIKCISIIYPILKFFTCDSVKPIVSHIHHKSVKVKSQIWQKITR